LIVSTGDEHLAVGSEAQTVNRLSVSTIALSFLARLRIPGENMIAARAHKGLAVGREGQRTDALVLPELADDLSGFHVPQAELVRGARGERLAVRRERQTRDAS